MNRKKVIITSLLMFVFLFILVQMNVFKTFQDSWGYILATSLVFGFLVNRTDKNVNQRKQGSNLNYDNLDAMRYIGSIIIIILHLRPFLNVSPSLDLLFNNIISRIFVPFFFLVTGYFVGLKQYDNPDYAKTYVKKMIPLYLTWNLIYLPFGLEYIQSYNLPFYLYPVALLIGLLYIGTYYHLWYFPALFISILLIAKLRKYFSFKTILITGFVLFCIGATETYWGILPTHLQDILQATYFTFFITTRNFLFFGFFFVAFGYYMGYYKITYSTHAHLKLGLSILAFVAEVFFLQQTDRLDSNLMIMIVPLIYYMFIVLVNSPRRYLPIKNIRELYKYYYLIHPLAIHLVQAFTNPATNIIYSLGLCAATIGATHGFTQLVIVLKKRYPKLTI